MSSEDYIDRVLFLSASVHVYMIPPLASSRGHVASTWTKPPAQEIHVDQARQLSPRLRILERSPLSAAEGGRSSDKLTVSILLESPDNGELFAAAPYNNANAVMQAVDSSRFFAITVVDSGRKAVLGIGFEERSEAFDFGVALQEARKSLQWESTPALNTGAGGQQVPSVKRDWSLKAGETMHVEVPKSKLRASREDDDKGVGAAKAGVEAVDGMQGGFSGLLPPPPSAATVKEERRRSREISADVRKQELADLGFDDGEFGEFQ